MRQALNSVPGGFSGFRLHTLGDASLNSHVLTLLQITLSQCHRLSRQRVSVMQGLKNEMCGLCSNLMLNNPRVLYDKYSKIPDAATVARLLVRCACPL